MRLERPVIGLGEAVPPEVADDDPQHAPGDLLTDLERDAGAREVLVGRPTEHVLGDDPGAAPGGEVRRSGREARLHRDVHRRVAHPEDDHAPVAEEGRILSRVVVRVDLEAGEPVAAREPGLRPARIPVVAVGDDQRVVAPAAAVVEDDLPGAVGGRGGAIDAGLEADPVAEAEVVDVGVEVLRDLRVMGEVGIRRRHREVGELHPGARRVDVQRAVRRRHPVAVLEHPVAADAVGLLEAVKGEPALVQRLGRGDARGPGADHADPRQPVHRVKDDARVKFTSRLGSWGPARRASWRRPQPRRRRARWLRRGPCPVPRPALRPCRARREDRHRPQRTGT